MEYMDFKNWIEFAGPYASLPSGGVATLVPACARFFHGVLCLVLHMIGVLGLGVDVYFCGRPEFITYKSIWWRLGYYMVAMTFQRFMYYTPWCISDAAVIACGLGYNGTNNGTHSWDRIMNIGVLGIELHSSSCIQMMAHWNHSIHMWLKN